MTHQHSRTLLLFGVIALASFLRLYQIVSYPPGLYPDEAMNGNNALEALHVPPPEGGFKVFYPENNGREGLFINIQAVALKLTGENEPWVLRLVSALFGILTVLGLYFLGKELYDKNTAVFAAFLLATSFWHLLFSRIGFRAISSSFWLTWALFFLLRAVRAAQESESGAKKISYFALAGLFYGLGFHSYIAYRATPPVIALVILGYLLLRTKESLAAKTGHLVLFTVIGLIAVAPLLWYFATTPGSFFGRTSEVSVFSSETPLHDLALNTIKTLGMFTYHGDWNWRHNYAGAPELFGPVGILFLIGVALGLYRLCAKGNPFVYSKGAHEKFPYLIIFSWFGLTFLPVVISNEGIPHALRSILMIPPVFLLASVGGKDLYTYLKRYLHPPLLRFGLVIFCILLIAQVYVAYFILWAPNPNTAAAFAVDYVALARELNALPTTTPKYVVVYAQGVDVRGFPTPTQTVMFLTDTFREENQRVKNIHYIFPKDMNTIPKGSTVFELH